MYAGHGIFASTVCDSQYRYIIWLISLLRLVLLLDESLLFNLCSTFFSPNSKLFLISFDSTQYRQVQLTTTASSNLSLAYSPQQAGTSHRSHLFIRSVVKHQSPARLPGAGFLQWLDAPLIVSSGKNLSSVYPCLWGDWADHAWQVLPLTVRLIDPVYPNPRLDCRHSIRKQNWIELNWFELNWIESNWFDLIWFDSIWFDFDLIWFEFYCIKMHIKQQTAHKNETNQTEQSLSKP